MKTKVLGVIYLMLLSVFSCNSEPSIQDQMVDNPGDDGQNENPDEGEELSYQEKAFATYEMIQQLYKKGDLYKENFPEQNGDREYSYLWPYVGMLTAGNVLYELGYDREILDKQFTGLEEYYDNRDHLPTYQAYPVSGGATDHYYDDSAIVAMELINAYELTNESFYLERAKTVTDFIMSGEDSRMGGGLYWFEGQSDNCTNGPNCMKAANTSAYAAYVTSKMYQLTNNEAYLTFAKRVYEWTYTTLRDPSDNLYWNDINIGSEQINTTKWTYNAAMMIMSAVNLYEISDDQEYLDEAVTTARSAHSKFTKVTNGRIFYPPNDSWFNVELLTAYIQLSQYDSKTKDYVEVFKDNMDYAWENARNNEGQFYEDWSGNNEGRFYWLLHQAALVEAFGRIAIYENQ
ncbi:glycoside hydrolase family 76 protein [Zunongwangia profunda]|uniref:glycoside hydrolase family 76 protein n=1 Tax=Zunongwangia profunda TaxID=398743 RepID=UPI001D192229|nr:glycoside hydrolase family 76 protein [Zunongwangia profunda]MCC4226853.1 glycoside hydrolase family 76 protein [Zunongwangia profunda]